jgi:hypothetical protein
MARGNAYCVILDHPLGQLECILWLLILCVLAYKLHLEDVQCRFFEHPDAQTILNLSLTDVHYKHLQAMQ